LLLSDDGGRGVGGEEEGRTVDPVSSIFDKVSKAGVSKTTKK
jgi:hypothetical protein